MKGLSVLVVLFFIIKFHYCFGALGPISLNSELYSNVIVQILQTYYSGSHIPVQINWMSSDPNKATQQDDLINQVLLSKSVIPNLLFHVANIRQKRSSFYNLIFVDSYSAFAHLMRSFDSLMYDFSGLYTIVMTGEPMDINVISKMFSDIWYLGIASAILLNVNLQRHQAAVNIYTYFPYTPGYCGVANPELIYSVYVDDINMSTVNLFQNRFKNFHNCSLTMGTFDVKPFIIKASTETSDNPKLSGFEADMISILAERLNFHLKYQFTPNETQWGSLGKANSTGLLGMIQRGEVDFGIGCMTFTKQRFELLKVGRAHYTSKLVFAIPEGRLYTPLEKLLRPFETVMWIAIGLCLSLGVVAVIGIQNSNMRHYFLGTAEVEPLMNMLNVVFGNAVTTSPDRCSVRAVLISWIYYCFVIRSVYQGLLFKYLQQEQRWPQVETIDDIQREKFPYHMTDVVLRFFENAPHILKRTTILPQGTDSLGKALERLALGKLHGVVLVPIDAIAYHNKYKAEMGMISKMKNDLSILPFGIHYPKKSPLPMVFDKVIADLHPSGLIDFLAHSYGTFAYLQEDQNDQGEPMPLTNRHLLGSYVLYLILNGVSFLVFLCEIACRKFRKKYHHKR